MNPAGDRHFHHTALMAMSSPACPLLLDHVLAYPVDILCDPCVDSGISWFTTLVTKGYNTDLYPVTLNLQHQWPSRVTLKTQAYQMSRNSINS